MSRYRPAINTYLPTTTTTPGDSTKSDAMTDYALYPPEILRHCFAGTDDQEAFSPPVKPLALLEEDQAATHATVHKKLQMTWFEAFAMAWLCVCSLSLSPVVYVLGLALWDALFHDEPPLYGFLEQLVVVATAAALLWCVVRLWDAVLEEKNYQRSVALGLPCLLAGAVALLEILWR